MPDLEIASSGADSAGAAEMAADLDSMDLGGDDAGTATSTEATSEEVSDDSGETAEAEVDLGIDDDPGPVGEAPLEEEPAPAKEEPPKDENGEELPDGVRVVDKNGVKEFRLREGRYRAFHESYKTAQAVEEILGEPLTPEAIEARHSAFVAQEAMIADFMSGDPGSESRFLENLAKWSQSARESGEVEHSPLRNIANRLPEFLLRSGDTEGFEAMAAPVFRAQLDQLYQEAAAPGNEDLFASLQHLDKRLFGSFKKRAEITAPDPLLKRKAELDAQEARIKHVDAQRSQRELAAWQAKTGEQIRSTVDEAIAEHLGPAVLKSYDKFPTELTAVKNLLRSEFQASLKNDSAWQQYLATIERRAANAKNPEVREAITAEARSKYKAKAAWWANPARNPKVKEILSQRAASIKATSDANHQRHATSAARREPGTAGAPPRQTVRETPNGRSSHDDWAAAIDAL